MNYLKNVGKCIGIMIGIILVLTLFVTILSYFNILNGNLLSFSKIFIIIVALFTGGIMIGKKSLKKGWLEGLKLSLIFIVLLTLFSTLGFQNKLEFKNILYYIILIISCMLGSMIGINKNIEKAN